MNALYVICFIASISATLALPTNVVGSRSENPFFRVATNYSTALSLPVFSSDETMLRWMIYNNTLLLPFGQNVSIAGSFAKVVDTNIRDAQTFVEQGKRLDFTVDDVTYNVSIVQKGSLTTYRSLNISSYPSNYLYDVNLVTQINVTFPVNKTLDEKPIQNYYNEPVETIKLGDEYLFTAGEAVTYDESNCYFFARCETSTDDKRVEVWKNALNYRQSTTYIKRNTVVAEIGRDADGNRITISVTAQVSTHMNSTVTKIPE